MDLISKRSLIAMQVGRSREVMTETFAWYRTARAAKWERLEDVHKNYPSAYLFKNVLAFNICNNEFRLITRVNFSKQRLYLKAFVTHKESDSEGSKK